MSDPIRRDAVQNAIYEGLRAHHAPGSTIAQTVLAGELVDRALAALDQLKAMER